MTCLEALDAAGVEARGTLAEGSDQLARRFVAFLARAQAAMNDLFQVVAAGQPSDVAAPHGAVDVAPEQHRDQLAHLIDVIALLPFPYLPPGDLGRRAHEVEGIGGHAVTARLVRRDPEIPQLQTLVLAHEYVERRQVAVQGLAAMQDVQRFQDAGDLLPHVFLGLRPLRVQPGAEIPVLRVLHDKAVAGAGGFGLHERVVHPQRAGLSAEELRKVGLAEPAGDPVADLDAHPRRERCRRRRRREVDLPETTFANETVQPVSPTGFVAVEGGESRTWDRWFGRPGGGRRATGLAGARDQSGQR